MKVTALVPAYNEEKTIPSVIDSLKQMDIIDEVLVIDDGSIDNTATAAKKAGARVISFDKNQGKGAALERGIQEITNDVILMLDADLIGLKTHHVQNLLEPVLKNKVDMTIGVFNEGRGLTDLAQLISPNLSGQRAVKKDVIDDIENLHKAGFGVEIALNSHVKKNGKLEFVELPELTHIMKEEKRGFTRGVLARGKMYWDIIKALLKSKIKN
ncbi:MAG: glycosyltransferase family 2 protein [Halothermotrichaceae bacterium]